MFWVYELLRELQGGSISACKDRQLGAGTPGSFPLSVRGLGSPPRVDSTSWRRGMPVRTSRALCPGPTGGHPQTSLTPVISVMDKLVSKF